MLVLCRSLFGLTHAHVGAATARRIGRAEYDVMLADHPYHRYQYAFHHYYQSARRELMSWLPMPFRDRFGHLDNGNTASDHDNDNDNDNDIDAVADADDEDGTTTEPTLPLGEI
jgi:hypothetical protein